jgi:hypothetical protein
MSGIQAANAIKGRPLNEGIDGPLMEQLSAGMAAAASGSGSPDGAEPEPVQAARAYFVGL